MPILNTYHSALAQLLTTKTLIVLNWWCSPVGPVFGGTRSSDRACGLQWDEASGQGHRLSEHVGGGDVAEERSQARYVHCFFIRENPYD